MTMTLQETILLKSFYGILKVIHLILKQCQRKPFLRLKLSQKLIRALVSPANTLETAPMKAQKVAVCISVCDISTQEDLL